MLSYLHFPKYSSSLLQIITKTANNTMICSINEYGLLYNALMVMEGADISQYSKRIGEVYDPTMKWSQTPSSSTTVTIQNTIAGLDNHSTATNAFNDTNINMCINNWLCFLGSCSTPCKDTANFSDIFIEFILYPNYVLSRLTIVTARIGITNPSYQYFYNIRFNKFLKCSLFKFITI